MSYTRVSTRGGQEQSPYRINSIPQPSLPIITTSQVPIIKNRGRGASSYLTLKIITVHYFSGSGVYWEGMRKISLSRGA